MSRHSTKFVLKEDKFNLKAIIYFFILVDLSLVPFGVWEALWYLAIYQATIIVSLMVGLRGQGRYKQAMGELQSVARNDNLTVDEREHILVQGIHHYCLELGFFYDERNKKYGLFKKKTEENGNSKLSLEIKNKNKKTKILRREKRMRIDEIVWKQVGYMIVGVWGFLGVALLELLMNVWVLSPLWIVTIEGIYYVINAFILFYVHYIFKLDPIVPPLKTLDIA